jgi:hypothetical protein
MLKKYEKKIKKRLASCHQTVKKFKPKWDSVADP